MLKLLNLKILFLLLLVFPAIDTACQEKTPSGEGCLKAEIKLEYVDEDTGKHEELTLWSRGGGTAPDKVDLTIDVTNNCKNNLGPVSVEAQGKYKVGELKEGDGKIFEGWDLEHVDKTAQWQSLFNLGRKSLSTLKSGKAHQVKLTKINLKQKIDQLVIQKKWPTNLEILAKLKNSKISTVIEKNIEIHVPY